MEVIDKLVAEYFIRRQHNPRVSPTNLLSALRFGDSPDCLKLKISSVLRDISNSLIPDTLDEGTLDLLEILEKLLPQQHSPLTESHKSAYCWTAAECTLRFMFPLSASDGLFTDAVEKIWTKRIGILKESGSGLVTQELLEWETDMRMALEDPEVYQRIRETNIRYTAICFLTQLVKEQCALLGSSTLESVTQRWLLKRKAENKSVDVTPNNANVTPEPARVNRTGTSGQDHNETPRQDNVSEKGSGSRGTWSGRARPRLLTPVPLNVYPLKKSDSSVRRRKKFWTPEEVEALREGVKEHGKSWKDIKNANPAVFAERTAVDLKDKWRNLGG